MSGADAPAPPDRRTIAVASAVLILTTTAGLLVLGPPGLVLGPVIDRFVMTRVLRGYTSPGPGLWSAVIGAVAILPAMAANSPDEDTRSIAVFAAVSAAVGGVVLGLLSLRTPWARYGAIGIGLSVAAVVVALVLQGQAA